MNAATVLRTSFHQAVAVMRDDVSWSGRREPRAFSGGKLVSLPSDLNQERKARARYIWAEPYS
jgi:hypothetical protein